VNTGPSNPLALLSGGLLPRPGFETLGTVVVSINVLSVLQGAGYTVADALSVHLSNRASLPWRTDVDLPDGTCVLVDSDPEPRRYTRLSIDGETILPSGRRVAPAVTFSFVEGATPAEIARSKGRTVTLDRFGRCIEEA
jgi:hypothetical protein